jgi:hypothetical protein
MQDLSEHEISGSVSKSGILHSTFVGASVDVEVGGLLDSIVVRFSELDVTVAVDTGISVVVLLLPKLYVIVCGVDVSLSEVLLSVKLYVAV